MGIGPHNTWKLKTILPPTKGPPLSIDFCIRLNYTELVIQYTQQLEYIAARLIFHSRKNISIGLFVKIVIIFLGDCCFENDFLKILYCEKQKQKVESFSDEDVRSLLKEKAWKLGLCHCHRPSFLKI